MPPVHPGEVLREDLMKPLGLTVNHTVAKNKLKLRHHPGYFVKRAKIKKEVRPKSGYLSNDARSQPAKLAPAS